MVNMESLIIGGIGIGFSIFTLYMSQNSAEHGEGFFIMGVSSLVIGCLNTIKGFSNNKVL